MSIQYYYLQLLLPSYQVFSPLLAALSFTCTQTGIYKQKLTTLCSKYVNNFQTCKEPAGVKKLWVHNPVSCHIVPPEVLLLTCSFSEQRRKL